jgi:hypothetical protein
MSMTGLKPIKSASADAPKRSVSGSKASMFSRRLANVVKGLVVSFTAMPVNAGNWLTMMRIAAALSVFVVIAFAVIFVVLTDSPE